VPVCGDAAAAAAGAGAPPPAAPPRPPPPPLLTGGPMGLSVFVVPCTSFHVELWALGCCRAVEVKPDEQLYKDELEVLEKAIAGELDTDKPE
jgi:hypothetical protein